jgi:hypothetical protein
MSKVEMHISYREMKCIVAVRGSSRRQECTFVVCSRVKKRGHILLVYQKKRKMEALLVVGEMG